MLEVLDTIENKKFKEGYSILTEACKKYPGLPKLFKLYIVDEDRIITPMKIMKMMKYFRVERSNDINTIGEIGEFASKRIELLKVREFKWDKRTGQVLQIHMNNVDYLIDTYNKLKDNVSSKKQYKIMKNCFLLISPTDVKWFVRILCRKFSVRKEMLEVIKDDQISNSM